MKNTLLIILLAVSVSGCKEKQECSYIVPIGYKLVYSDSKKTYSIQTNHQYLGLIYLHDYRSAGIMFNPQDIREPTIYKDSCIAKGALHRYIGTVLDTISDFK